jgi:hypothetical protein
MKRLTTMAVCCAGAVVLNPGARAEPVLSPDNPYAAIAVRNVFALSFQPPVPTPTQDATPTHIIKPDGIMSIFGQLQVLFKVASGAKSGPIPKETAYILGEGQRQDDIEVVQINELAGSVTFNNHGIVQVIPLPNATTNGASITGMPGTMPGRPKPNLVGTIGSGRIPPYLSGGDDQEGQNPQIPRTKEQQMMMIEALRAYYKSQHDPRANTLPATAMTPPDAFDPPTEDP